MANKHWDEMTVDEKLDWLRRTRELDLQAVQLLAGRLDELTKRVAVLHESAAGVDKPRR